MNSAFTHQGAETKAGRMARAARCAVVACALVLAAGGAMAQQYGDRRDDQGSQQGQRSERFHLPPQDRDRQAEMRAMEDRRMQQQQQQDQQSERRGGRMTQDERRDLRRQINEAGRDLYPRQR